MQATESALAGTEQQQARLEEALSCLAQAAQEREQGSAAAEQSPSPGLVPLSWQQVKAQRLKTATVEVCLQHGCLRLQRSLIEATQMLRAVQAPANCGRESSELAACLAVAVTAYLLLFHASQACILLGAACRPSSQPLSNAR